MSLVIELVNFLDEAGSVWIGVICFSTLETILAGFYFRYFSTTGKFELNFGVPSSLEPGH